jgi:endoglucanase Acf2
MSVACGETGLVRLTPHSQGTGEDNIQQHYNETSRDMVCVGVMLGYTTRRMCHALCLLELPSSTSCLCLSQALP